jgi:hypothetical protein
MVDGQETMHLTTIKTARERGIAFVVSRQDSTGLWHDFETLAGEHSEKQTVEAKPALGSSMSPSHRASGASYAVTRARTWERRSSATRVHRIRQVFG